MPRRSTADQSIILDIDETLVHTYEDGNLETFRKLYGDRRLYGMRSRMYHMKLIDVGEPVGSGDVWEMWGMEREGMIEFLKYCFERFKYVIIWSAGQKRYVERISERLFRWTSEPHIVLSWDDCRHKNDRYDKPIAQFKSKFPEYDIGLTNTFIVDDRCGNFEQANRDNGIHIPPYSPKPEYEHLISKDSTLYKLIQWFQRPEVVASVDIRTLDKTNIW